MTRARRVSGDTPHYLADNDARRALGEVLIVRTVRAVGAKGEELGTFDDRDQASRAIIRVAGVPAKR
jgi:hypothetical protein